MGDFFENFKKQQQINEGLFDNIFGKKKEPNVQNNIEKPSFYQREDGVFVFGDVSTTLELNADARMPLMTGEFNLKNSKLSFLVLPGTEFHATQMGIDLKKQLVTFFKGDWNSGPFQGKTFQGKFEGSSFVGSFIGPYTNFESNPITFVDGTFRDTTGKGILGMPNTITLEKSKNRKFNLITIPVGHYLQFRSVNGITGYIKVIKRLDGINSSFKFEVLNGFAGKKSPEIISLQWDYFRQNWKLMEINPKNPINFGGLIEVPEGDSIKEMYVSVAPATFITPEKPADVVAPEAIPTEPEIKSIEPGLNPDDIQSAWLKESVRKSVRNIINKNF